jgi:hypothetical protein
MGDSHPCTCGANHARQLLAGDTRQPCPSKCGLCEGMDHHWIPHCDEENPEPMMVCKHCPASRPYGDDDDDFRTNTNTTREGQ